MSQQLPPTPGTRSPDGAYVWDGSTWVPNVPVGQAAVPPKKGHMGRNLGIGCLGLILLTIVIVALSVSRGGSSTTSSSGGGSGRTASCSPTPCANADGFAVSISNLNRNAPAGQFIKPEAGNHFVIMQTTLHNGSGDSKSANPLDFKLRDLQGQEHAIAFSDTPGCETWQAVDLAVNASLGPKGLCFEAAGDPNGKLTIIWSPGFFSSKVEIPLQ